MLKTRPAAMLLLFGPVTLLYRWKCRTFIFYLMNEGTNRPPQRENWVWMGLLKWTRRSSRCSECDIRHDPKHSRPEQSESAQSVWIHWPETCSSTTGPYKDWMNTMSTQTVSKIRSLNSRCSDQRSPQEHLSKKYTATRLFVEIFGWTEQHFHPSCEQNMDSAWDNRSIVRNMSACEAAVRMIYRRVEADRTAERLHKMQISNRTECPEGGCKLFSRSVESGAVSLYFIYMLSTQIFAPVLLVLKFPPNCVL